MNVELSMVKNRNCRTKMFLGAFFATNDVTINGNHRCKLAFNLLIV